MIAGDAVALEPEIAAAINALDRPVIDTRMAQATKVIDDLIRARSIIVDPKTTVHHAVLICIGGALARVYAANIRGKSQCSNYSAVKSTGDPFVGSALENKSVQVHTTWLPISKDSRQLSNAVHNVFTNWISNTVGQTAPPATKRTIFVVGGYLDLIHALEGQQDIPVPQLVWTWSNALWDQLITLRRDYECDVCYLGTGVPSDHQRLGDFIHIFNGVLMNKISKSFPPSVYPRIYFVDLYTPTSHKTWAKVDSDSNSFRVEPQSMLVEFWSRFRMYALMQCRDSNIRRENMIAKHGEPSAATRSMHSGRARSRSSSRAASYSSKTFGSSEKK